MLEEFFYRYSPLILACAGIIFGVTLTTFDRWVDVQEYSYSISYFVVVFACAVYGGVIGKMMQKLHYGMHIDTLTGLWNRRYFYKKLDEELNRTEKTGSPTALAIVDIDNFKQINDEYGHLCGDEIIKQVAKSMRHNVRKLDSVVRWGGDEFAIILSGIDNDRALKVGDKILKDMETFPCFECRVTLSVGIASTTVRIDSETLMRRADQALFRSKKTRNNVTLF